MAWVRLDDGFPDHIKLAELGDYAPVCGWLFVCGLAFCNRQLSDGRIPRAHIRRLVGFEGVTVQGVAVQPDAIAAMLVKAGLWDDTETHFVVHDYLEYQPSRSEVLKERAQASERKARWEERRSERRYSQRSERRENACPEPEPVPDPIPDPKSVYTQPARAQAQGALAGTLPRDHMDHGFCGPRFCVSTKILSDMARRYGAGGEAAVQTWLQSLSAGLRDDESAGGPVWILQRFDAFLAASGRVLAAPSKRTSEFEAMKARLTAKAKA